MLWESTFKGKDAHEEGFCEEVSLGDVSHEVDGKSAVPRNWSSKDPREGEESEKVWKSELVKGENAASHSKICIRKEKNHKKMYHSRGNITYKQTRKWLKFPRTHMSASGGSKLLKLMFFFNLFF